MKRVVSNGKCNDAKLAAYLKTGRIYEVAEERNVDGVTKFILKGIPKECEYNAEWFKILIVDTVFSKKVPVVGEVMNKLLVLEKSQLIPTDVEVNVMNVNHIGGNVYEVYAQYRNYIVVIV